MNEERQNVAGRAVAGVTGSQRLFLTIRVAGRDDDWRYFRQAFQKCFKTAGRVQARRVG